MNPTKYRPDVYGFITWFKEKTDTDLTRDYLEFIEETKGMKVDEDALFVTISNYFGITREQIFSKRRISEIADARFFAMVVLRQRYTFKAIGLILGGYHHTTVLNGINAFESHYQYEKSYKIKVDNALLELGLKLDENLKPVKL